MAISFPSNPTTGDTYVANGKTWKFNGVKWTSPPVVADVSAPTQIASATQPAGTINTGSIWFNTSTNAVQVYNGTSWSNVSSGGGTGAFSMPVGNTSQRPASPTSGMVRINSDTGYLEAYYSGSWNNTASIMPLGSASAVAASSATALQTAGYNTNGSYWINVSGTPMQCYVDFVLAGGPYILVMVAASTGTTYDYDGTVWTNTTGGVTTALDPTSDTNQVHAAFYTLATTRTGLALHQPSTSYFHYLDHTSGIPRNLANGGASPPGSISPNGTTIAANSIIPSLSPGRPLGWYNAITAAGYTAQSNGATYYRFGYDHGVPSPSQFGYTRFGFTADLDSSDSHDRGIGIGIKNGGGGPVATFSASAGRWDYNDGTTGYKNNLKGYLYIKN